MSDLIHPDSWGDPSNPNVDVQELVVVKKDTPTDEYRFHLIRAEYHLERAMGLLEGPAEPKRSFRCQMLLSRAHGIIAGIFKQEMRR